MKIVLENVFGLLCFIVYQYLCLAKENVNIGVLFNEYDPQITLPLNNSIDPRYTYNKPVDFSAQLQQVSATDNYEASKTFCDLIGTGNGVSAIFGSESTFTSPLLESMSSRFQIPYIVSSWRETNNDDTKLTINLYPETNLLARGIADIVRSSQWPKIVVLYETAEGLIKLQEVLKLKEYQKDSKKNNLIVKYLGTGPDYRPLLKQFDSTIGTIILDCKTENIIPILNQAKELNMMSIQDSFFLTSLDTHTLDFSIFESTTATIITLRLFDNNSGDFRNTVISWETVGHEPESGQRTLIDPKTIKTEVALIQDGIRLFKESVFDLHSEETPIQTAPIKCDEESTFVHGIQLRESMLSKSGFSGMSGPIDFDEFGNRINFNLYAVNILKNQLFSTWSAQNQSVTVQMSENETIDAATENLQKILVIVSSRVGEPYLFDLDPHGKLGLEGNARYEGYSMDLIDMIAQKLNLTYKFEITADGKYGNYVPETKKWTGLIGDLLERRAHLAICDLTITYERREVVDFSTSFMTLGISILYQKPGKKDIDMYAFMDPFDISVWIYTVTLYLAITIVLYFVSRMTPGDWENPHPCEEDPEELENIWDIKNCLWLTLGSIMTQGCDILPKGISSRMAVSMWWFFSLIMTSSYTANLAAFLTKKNMEIPIDGAEALAKQTKIKYGTLSGGSTESFFRNSNYSTYKRMWNTMDEQRQDVFVENNNDGVDKVLKSKNALYAYLMESTSIEYHTETKCELKQIGNWLDSKHFGIAMPLNAPYRGSINQAIFAMQESGELTKLKDKWWKEKRTEPRCSKDDDEEDGADLALTNVGGVFILLGVGTALSILLAILEFLWNVRNVSVEEHLTYWEALKMELKFACNICITKKRTKPKMSENSSSKSDTSDKTDEKSIVHSILHNATSFIHLNNLSSQHS